MEKIPFNKLFISEKESSYITQAIASGSIAGNGRFTRACCRLMEERFGIHEVLLTPSCTAALEMAAMLCDLGPGDEVIVPSFTFVSTVNAFVRQGAKPVFVDIRPDTMNLDETLIEDAITERTKTIWPVHYAGVGCEMERIMSIARGYDLLVVEDAAQGVDAFYNGRALGSIGHLGTYSFHETKNCTSGRGGALCINHPPFAERAEMIHDNGTNRQAFLRGEVDHYTWTGLGSSYVPGEIVAAFLYAQLEMLDLIGQQRREVHQFYRRQLEPLEAEGFLTLPSIPEECTPNDHMFYILLPDRETRDGLLAYLHSRGIQAVFHYVPLHSSPMGQKFGYCRDDLPVTEDVSGRLLRLPFYYTIREDEQLRTVEEIRRFAESNVLQEAAYRLSP